MSQYKLSIYYAQLRTAVPTTLRSAARGAFVEVELGSLEDAKEAFARAGHTNQLANIWEKDRDSWRLVCHAHRESTGEVVWEDAPEYAGCCS